ncbi:MAG: hypothetical protein M0R74_00895 [Dehalococcoidia bacterium]|nr:hypothetical protein [Dehalococcoidia bacterium]
MSKVEIRDDQREALERIAEARGERDLSQLVQEVLDQFLAGGELDQFSVHDERERMARIRALQGSISDEDAEEMLAIVQELREHWR